MGDNAADPVYRQITGAGGTAAQTEGTTRLCGVQPARSGKAEAPTGSVFLRSRVILGKPYMVNFEVICMTSSGTIVRFKLWHRLPVKIHVTPDSPRLWEKIPDLAVVALQLCLPDPPNSS